ncbi:rod-binding protein [Niveispirillum sp. KHB5.9]|uniref:rod-binding protein n=1 Tax=Niveispirillum sp. KHB5.9 TaxID=3400269 RepID=UPI003A889C5C
MEIAEIQPPARPLPAAGPLTGTAATEAARKFEALLLSQALNSMFEGVSTEGMFGGGYAEEVFRGMMLDSVAESMASSPGGFGIAGHVRAQIAQYDQSREG